MTPNPTCPSLCVCGGKVWVYRNLVQPYANFVQLREKIADPNYAGWFLPFDPATNNESLTPRCEFNPRLGRELCSDLFHTRLAWTENGHDCGDVVPCGDYVFDHRNASLREWIVKEWIMGPLGAPGKASVVLCDANDSMCLIVFCDRDGQSVRGGWVLIRRLVG